MASWCPSVSAVRRAPTALTAPRRSGADRRRGRARVHVRLRRARRVARGGGGRGGGVRPDDGRRAPARDRTRWCVGGGFPEVYAGGTVGQRGLRAEVRDRVAAGHAGHRRVRGPALARPRTRRARAVRGAAGRRADDRKLTLGYREAVAAGIQPAGPGRDRGPGHEFHRTVSAPAHGPSPAWRLSDGSEHGWASASPDRLLPARALGRRSGCRGVGWRSPRAADSRRAART